MAKIVNLPKIFDKRGNLSFIEGRNHLPFEIRRTYWIYDVPGGEVRGGHAYRENEEFVVALSGSFDVVLHNGVQQRRFSLNRSYYGLYIPKMTWRTGSRTFRPMHWLSFSRRQSTIRKITSGHSMNS